MSSKMKMNCKRGNFLKNFSTKKMNLLIKQDISRSSMLSKRCSYFLSALLKNINYTYFQKQRWIFSINIKLNSENNDINYITAPGNVLV